MPRDLALGQIDFAKLVRPGDLVSWGQSAAEPVPLTRRLMEQRHAIGRFGVFLGISHQGAADPTCADRVDFTGYCGTGDNRRLAEAGCLDPLPSHYSDMAAALPGRVDVLLVQVAPGRPGEGYSLGLAHEYLVPLVKRARVVVAEVNDRCPWTCGDGILDEGDIDFLVRTARPPAEVPSPPPGTAELAVARQVAGLIGDGATLQVGIGALPRAILTLLHDRRDLGIHSGVIGDEVADLIESGAVTNACKGIDQGMTVAGLLSGTGRLYRFAHRNPALSSILRTLTRLRLVAFRSDDKTYSLGMGMAELAAGMIGISHAELIHPELERLALNYDLLVVLWRVTGDGHLVLIDRAHSESAVRVEARLGLQLPMMAGAVGRCVAAALSLPDSELRRRFAALRWQSPPPFEDYRQSVALARERGWSMDDGCLYRGLVTVAALVTDHNGQPRFGLSGIAISGQQPVGRLESLGRALHGVAGMIGTALFPRR